MNMLPDNRLRTSRRSTGRRGHVRTPARRGLSLVEVLLCASIGAMILTAVAVAFRASFNSYRDNQQRGQMLNSVRGCLYKMTEDIRNCDVAWPYDPNSTVYNTENSQFGTQYIVPGNPTSGMSSAGGSGVLGIQMLKTHSDSIDPTASTANPVTITYWYDNTQQEIFTTRKYGSSPASSPAVVSQYVQSLQIYMLPQYVPPNPQANLSAGATLRRATVTITLANKAADGSRILAEAGQDLTLVLTDSAVPRRTFPGL